MLSIYINIQRCDRVRINEISTTKKQYRRTVREYDSFFVFLFLGIFVLFYLYTVVHKNTNFEKIRLHEYARFNYKVLLNM